MKKRACLSLADDDIMTIGRVGVWVNRRQIKKPLSHIWLRGLTKTEKSKFISVQVSSSLSSTLAGFSSGARGLSW